MEARARARARVGYAALTYEVDARVGSCGLVHLLRKCGEAYFAANRVHAEILNRGLVDHHGDFAHAVERHVIVVLRRPRTRHGRHWRADRRRGHAVAAAPLQGTVHHGTQVAGGKRATPRG